MLNVAIVYSSDEFTVEQYYGDHDFFLVINTADSTFACLSGEPCKVMHEQVRKWAVQVPTATEVDDFLRGCSLGAQPLIYH